MDWELIKYDVNTGKYNMEFDLKLVQSIDENKAYLRFYGWKPYCISLGANQSSDEIDSRLAFKDNIDIVRRPTGGRAVLHAEELTYSVVLPNYNTFSGKDVYYKISNAILDGLKLFSPKLQNAYLEKDQADFPNILKQNKGTLCFASSAKNEIKFNGKKLVGSAQRIIGNSILQHGSILIGNYHQNLVKYLSVNDNVKQQLINDLLSNTTEIETIINKSVVINELIDALISAFQKTFICNFSNLNIPQAVG